MKSNEQLDALFDAEARELSALYDALERLLGPEARLVGSEPLAARVWRLHLQAARSRRSVVVKQIDPVVAHRNRMLAERWLPSVGLEEMGPGLLLSAMAPGGHRAWQVHEDWGDAGLDRRRGDRRSARAVARAVAHLHLRFADHALLGECRLWGRDLGMSFYASSVRDALRAVEAAAPASVGLSSQARSARERLRSQLRALLREEPARARAMEELGGPETLVHGDLWAENVLLLPSRDRLQVRLIDWDRLGVARFPYDLSTLLLRSPSELRAEVLAEYEEVVSLRGWQLPGARELNGLFDTAERARLANLAIWPALTLLRGEHALREWAFTQLSEVSLWLDALEPVLSCPRSAVA